MPHSERAGFSRRTLLQFGSVAGLGFAASALSRGASGQTAAPPLKIGIIGSGHIGSTIGSLWVKAGHPVMFSSRHPEEIAPLVQELGALAKSGAVADAITFGDVVFMAIGTGIAGAIFIAGTLYTGRGMAGEVGHSKVADGPVCACGGAGCLEAVASAGAIARRYSQATGKHVAGAKDVLARAERGDADARQIWESALDGLALDLSHTVALLAPEAIVIGGGLSQAGAALFEPLQARLDAILTFHARPTLLRASIGADAGVIGAALRARDLVEPSRGRLRR